MDYNIPQLAPSAASIPEHFMDFNKAMSFKGKHDRYGVHFFIQDYLYERIWNRPRRYIKKLSKYAVLLSPNFDVCAELPRATQIWNVFRNRTIGRYWQDKGLPVIPTVNWSDEASFDFCFEGIQPGGIIAVTTRRSFRLPQKRDDWRRGVSEAIRRLTPSKILVYGSMIDFNAEGADVTWIPARNFISSALSVKNKNKCGQRTQYIIDNPDIVRYWCIQFNILEQDFADVYQEVILRSMEYEDNFCPQKASIKTWSSKFVKVALLTMISEKNSQERLFSTELFDQIPVLQADFDLSDSGSW